MRPRKHSPNPPSLQPERLQKLLAAAGFGSRREIEGWITAGRVRVEGRQAVLGERATPGAQIEIDGRPVQLGTSQAVRVLLYHKPVGELVTRSDPQGRATVFERLPRLQEGRWVAVGRLDLNSSGLLLFTNSGALANQLMHPSREIEREYAVRVQGELRAEDARRLREGIALEDGVARFTRIAAMGKAEGTNRWYRAVLREGRNREVRRLFEAAGLRVNRLIRVRFGPLELPRELKPARWIELSGAALEAIVGAAKS